MADVQRTNDIKGIEEAKERLKNGEPARSDRLRAPGRFLSNSFFFLCNNCFQFKLVTLL